MSILYTPLAPPSIMQVNLQDQDLVNLTASPLTPEALYIDIFLYIYMRLALVK